MQKSHECHSEPQAKNPSITLTLALILALLQIFTEEIMFM